MTNQIQDLKLILQAIETQRSVWRLLLDIRLNELMLESPTADFQTLYKRALTSSDVSAEYTKLVTIYGLIGEQSSDYLKALETTYQGVA